MCWRSCSARRYVVLNRAVSGYSTAEHLLQTAFYGTPYGEMPRCAIYQVGWGDLPSAHIRALDPGYADYHMPWLIDALHARWLGGPILTVSPTLALLAPLATWIVDTARPPPEPARTPGSGADPAFEAVYVRNLGDQPSARHQDDLAGANHEPRRRQQVRRGVVGGD
jgi:hypothetical protein